MLTAHLEWIKEKDSYGDTPLHRAAANEAPAEVVELLLAAYPEAAKEKNSYGVTPLHLAAANKVPAEVVELLLTAFLKVATMEDLPLHLAAICKPPLEMVKELLAAYPEAAKEKNSDGNTPLHRAAANKAPAEVVELLLAAYPEAAKEKNSDGNTPLHLAVDNEAPAKVVELLLAAYPEAAKEKDSDGNTPLQKSLENEVFTQKSLEYEAAVFTLMGASPSQVFTADIVAQCIKAVPVLLEPKFFTADRLAKLLPGVYRLPATTLLGLLYGVDGLRREAQRLKVSDSLRAERVIAHELRVQLLVAALLSVVYEYDAEGLLVRLLATKQGATFLTFAMRLDCRVVVAQPSVQWVLSERWQGGAEMAETAGPMLILLLGALGVLSSLLAVLIPPLLEAAVAMAANPAWRGLLAAQALALLGVALFDVSQDFNNFGENYFDNYFEDLNDLVCKLRWALQVLAGWSLAIAIAPAAVAATILAPPWWARLAVLPGLAVVIYVMITDAEKFPYALAACFVITGPLASPVLTLTLGSCVACVVLAIALWPPLGQMMSALTVSNSPSDLLFALAFIFTPRAKFYISSLSRILLSCLLIYNQHAGAPLVSAGLSLEPMDAEMDWQGDALIPFGAFAWLMAVIIDESWELATAPDLWRADVLNMLEMPGLLLALVATADSVVPVPAALTFSPSSAASMQAYGVLFMLSAQGLRLLQTSSLCGPLVIAVLTMAQNDLPQWLLLVAVGVLLPFVGALYLLFGRVDETLLEGECADIDTRLGNLYLNAWAMAKVLIGGGGDAYIDCLEATSSAAGASSLFLLYVLFTGVLLLNLLIAQFGNTFSNISEKAPQNFQFGFGRLVIKAEKLWVLPPPLNLLSALYVLVLAGRFVSGKCVSCMGGNSNAYQSISDKAAGQGELNDLDLGEGFVKSYPMGPKLAVACSEEEKEEEDKVSETLPSKLLTFMDDPDNEEEQEGAHRKQLRKSVGDVKQQVAKMEAKVEAKVGKVEAQVKDLAAQMAQQLAQMAQQQQEQLAQILAMLSSGAAAGTAVRGGSASASEQPAAALSWRSRSRRATSAFEQPASSNQRQELAASNSDARSANSERDSIIVAHV